MIDAVGVESGEETPTKKPHFRLEASPLDSAFALVLQREPACSACSVSVCSTASTSIT